MLHGKKKYFLKYVFEVHFRSIYSSAELILKLFCFFLCYSWTFSTNFHNISYYKALLKLDALNCGCDLVNLTSTFCEHLKF
jgi:hypothetical protein